MIVTAGGVELAPVERSPGSDTRQFEYDTDATPAGMAVISAISEVLQTDPMAMEPLQRTVDVDALDRLLSDSEDIEVTLQLVDHAVTVTSDGVITVRPTPTVDRLDPPK